MKLVLFSAEDEGLNGTSPEPKPVENTTVKKSGRKPKSKSSKRSKPKAAAKRKPAKKRAKPSKRVAVKKAKRKSAKKRAKKSNGGRPLMFPDKTIVRMPKGFLKIINAKARKKKQLQGEFLRAVIARGIGKSISTRS